ncbi:glycerate kinase [Nodosilinea sp. E11]|uniref:glycerate kinase n=1 Tax=Nodosilinea sp. E11 TaxID=3037479 RepID=UPI00293508DB|nr:glycerate kinase [Nodosilinea sp. E11]WOD38073.1 glycerate kinase [Nodosilinea sp. E11]
MANLAETSDNFAIAPILIAHLAGNPPTSDQMQQLLAWELADPLRAAAWGITPDNGEAQLQTRLHWLQTLVSHHAALPLPPAPMERYLGLYWRLWLPLALTLKQARDDLNAPLIQGILGGQGTGKTTLTLVLRHILGVMGYNAVGLSIDDLYKTYRDRQLLVQADPRLRWRGPPGTHDIDLGLATLDQVRSAVGREAVALPRFDKSLHGGEGDRIAPEWVEGIDILLFEGWFLGARPIDPARFDQAPEPIATEADRQFARDMNAQLATYLPLWDCLDRLMVLCPADYRLSKQWRKDAEHQMKAQGKTGMSDATIDEFVEYFWRALHPELFITLLKGDREHVNLVIEIDHERTPKAIYSPALAFV